MSTPPVTQLVLYKHGIALIGRSGCLDGDFTLALRRDDMKDVLKSLAVEILDGQASIGTISFDSPAQPRDELAQRNLLLSPGTALIDLFDALTGRTVEVSLHKKDKLRGEVIGVDDAEAEARRTLMLRTASGRITLVDLADARRITLVEEPSRHDLDYLVDRSRAANAGPNCQLRVAVAGSAESARLSYVVAAPVWRVSYRLLRDGDRLMISAMGIVHNPVDEDLTDVELTLTTGRPMSFDIDLYTGRRVQRAVVEEPELGAAPPARRSLRSAAAMGAPVETGAFDAYSDAVDDVETGDRGEYFEYRIASPVSLPRGGAAMVPLVVAGADDLRRELIWAPGGGEAPDIVLTFTNSTGIVLEEGPAVIYEDGGYAGEAMLDFTERSARVRLAFAKDLAVRCRHDRAVATVTAAVRLADDAVVEERRTEVTHTVYAENTHDEPVEVIVELRRRPGHHFDVRDAATAVDSEDPMRHRFAVPVPAHARVTATVLESWPEYTRIDYQQLSPGRLDQWLTDRSLDAETIAALAGVLDNWAHAERLDARCQARADERDEIYAAQTRITEQLAVLGTDGPEGELRQRRIAELQQRNTEADEIQAAIQSLRTEAAAAREAAEAALAALIGDS